MKTEHLSEKTKGHKVVFAAVSIVVVFAMMGRQPVSANGLPQPLLPDYCNQTTINEDGEVEGVDTELPRSLKCSPAPEPYMLDEHGGAVSLSPGIVKNKAALVALGKMLFWDAQVGSDGVACASCHFHAGGDNRIKNQINPGIRNESGQTVAGAPIGSVFNFMDSYLTANNLDYLSLNPLQLGAGKGPNYTLKKSDFPLKKYQEPTSSVYEPDPDAEVPEIVVAEADPAVIADAAQVLVAGIPRAPQSERSTQVVYESDDVISSQGVYPSKFNSLTPPGNQEICDKRFPTSGSELPIFNVAGYTVRQAAPRNTPTVINAVYNYRNFWDGRANHVFNGVDPFGLRSFTTSKTPDTEIYAKAGGTGTPMKQRILIYNASLASQAVGPALSDLEMSCGGKAFPELGKKMLLRKPLANQKVDSTDSVLGSYSKAVVGLKTEYTYKKMIQDAFNNAYWDDLKKVGNYTLTENNFSLFWGLAIQAYEATLVSDESRFDKAYANPNDPQSKLTAQEENGKELFMKADCVACHSGAEFTAASIEHVENANNLPNRSKYIERMMMGDGGIALYDSGFYNIGVRPTAEDVGLGSKDPYGFPLSFSRNAKMYANDPVNDFTGMETPNISSLGADPFLTNSELFESDVGCIAWNPATVDQNTGLLCGTSPVIKDERDAVDGAFKSPTLRNVELTGPYFHNGGQATLEQVIHFYNRGGDRNDYFLKDGECNGAELAEDAYGNLLMVADPQTKLIDSTGYLPNGEGSGYASNLDADMAGHRKLESNPCNTGKLSSQSLRFSNQDVDDLVAFLKTLTDERVRWEQAPFDHPALTLPHGHVGDETWVKPSLVTNQAQQMTYTLPAVGKLGRGVKGLQPIKSFETGLQ